MSHWVIILLEHTVWGLHMLNTLMVEAHVWPTQGNATQNGPT